MKKIKKSKLMNWLKMLFSVFSSHEEWFEILENIYDSSDIVANKYKPLLVVHADGMLCYHSKYLFGEVTGAGEWPENTKECLNLPKGVVVLDVYVEPIEIHE